MNEYSEVWCSMCAEPADGRDALCTPHREGVPASVTDPWLAKQWLATVRRQPRDHSHAVVVVTFSLAEAIAARERLVGVMGAIERNAKTAIDAAIQEYQR